MTHQPTTASATSGTDAAPIAERAIQVVLTGTPGELATVVHPEAIDREPSAEPPAARGVGSAALLAGVAAELVVGLARALDVPMRAGAIGADTPVTLPPGLVGLEAAIAVLAGAIIAKALSSRSRHPRRSFQRLATTLTTLSLVSPIAAGATTTATKVTLVAAHMIVAAIAIPLLSRALPRAQVPQQHRGTSPAEHSTHSTTSSSPQPAGRCTR